MAIPSISSGRAAQKYWESVLAAHQQSGMPVDAGRLLIELEAERRDTKSILGRLARDGVATVENYWTPEQCRNAVADMDGVIDAYPDCVRKFSEGSDCRVFGIEMVSDAAMRFHVDSYLRSIGELAGGRDLYNLATLGGRIEATQTNRGSGDGWHRDSFGYQFKAIIYLCDVTLANGPFQYLLGSHRKWQVVLDSALGRLPVPPESRMSDEQIDRYITSKPARARIFTAKAGTLILANTTGIHRGMPLQAGRRYALTNYYYHRYQIGRSLVEKFMPMIPAAYQRLLEVATD